MDIGVTDFHSLRGTVLNETKEVNQSSEKLRCYPEPWLIVEKENPAGKFQLEQVGGKIKPGQLHGSVLELENLPTPVIDLNFLAPVAAALFESTRNGVIVTDAQSRIQVVNRGFSELTGFSTLEVLGLQPQAFLSALEDDAFFVDLWAQIKIHGFGQCEVRHRRKNGELYLQMLSINAIKNKFDKITHYVWIFSDITHLKDTVTRLNFLAHHDPLTSLPNRLLLFARLQHCMAYAQREHKSAAMLMLDLDRFKHVNDNFGHFVGDDLLKQVAFRLTNRLRGIDMITRLGGDEFAIFLEDLSHPQDAARVASEIIAAIGEPFLLCNGSEVKIGASVGISLFPEHGKTPEQLLQQADAALYRAKHEGRGKFKYYSEDLTHAAMRRINLESLLRRAVSKNELKLNYQPQIEISSGKIVGAEVLLRWHNATEGVIPPNQFIPIAEECGLISEIGVWVLRAACQQGQAWLAAGLPQLKLAINLSPLQFLHGDIATTIAEILRETNFPAAYLELELTETALMEREGEAALILTRLQTLGVCLSLDDFGTGYSSLAYLKRFPLNMLKIAKTFIDDLPLHQSDKEITTAIIGLGHTLGLKVLAEGVETQEQLDFLKDKGCDFYQGFFNSPGLEAEDFARLFAV